MEAKKVISKTTDGLCRTAVNGVLWWFYLTGASVHQTSTSRGVYQTFSEADKALEEFNYDSFKQIYQSLKKKEYIKRTRNASGWSFHITEKGLKALEEDMVIYKKTRVWDGFLYVISYDIPEKHHYARDLLRKYLKQNSCAMLQKSIWITPYNPTQKLEEFVKEKMPSVVLFISKMGKDGAIGYQNREDLVEEVFDLKTINGRYKDLLDDFHKRKVSLFTTKSAFFNILKDDPQLPAKFLPKDWMGDKAYQEIVEKV